MSTGRAKIYAGAYEGDGDVEAARALSVDGNGVVFAPVRDSECCSANLKRRIWETTESSLTNRYLLANIVYIIYAFGILYIDYVAYPHANETYAEEDYEYCNRLYVAMGVLHLVNAFMYAWSWLPQGFSLCSIVMIPEYLNVLGATLYLYTATLYSQLGDTYLDDLTFRVHYLETFAAAVEVIAALGWCTTWWLTYPRGQPGRGWTLDDPDVGANIFIVVPSAVYMAYNLQILQDATQYGANMLYAQGDVLYAIGAFFYLAASLRDDGWFWFLPTAGQCNGGVDAITPLEGNVDAASQGCGCSCRGALPPVRSWPCFTWRQRSAEDGSIGAGLSLRQRVTSACARLFAGKAEAQSLLSTS